MTTPVQFDFGDGSPKVDGTQKSDNSWTAEHTYSQSGTHTVTAIKGELTATTQVTVDLDGGGPARPVLNVPEIELSAGDSDVEQHTTLTNSQGSSQNCTGRIEITDGAPLDGKISCVMKDFNGPGADLTVDWVVDGNDLIGTYGQPDGFPIPNPLNGATTNLWSVDADAPAGDYSVSTSILDSEGNGIASSGWWIHLSAAAVARTLTAVNPNTTANVGDLITLTGTGLTGIGVASLINAGGFGTPADNLTVVSDTQATGNIASGSAGVTVARIVVADNLSELNGPSRAELSGLNLVVT